MRIQTKFILPLSILFITGISVLVILSDIRESKQDITREKNVWISLGENLSRSWKSVMRFTGSDNLARDQFYQNPADFEISRQIVRNPQLTRINPEGSPYASSDLEMRVIRDGKAISQIIESDSSPNLVTLTPIVAEEECVTCHQQVSHHDVQVGDVMGAIKLTSSLEHIYAQIAQDRYIRILGMTLIFLIGIIVIYYITKRLTEPISQLTESSQLVAQGNLDIRTNIERKDELGILGNAFNTMIEKLRDSTRNLEVALRNAEKADEVKTLFLANMSHEIRTPLNAILGFTDLIKQSTEHLVSPEERAFFETIERSGERLMRTVHEILDISQIEAGTIDLNPMLLDLAELTEGVVQDFQAMAKDKGVQLSFVSPVTSAIIHADEYSITQAVTNLVDNAIKYTERGRVDVALKGEGNKVLLTIEDTGIGISEEYLKQLFEIFSQESTGYTRKFEGVGLGLALTKRYLDMNNVAIDVQSTVGVGTKFTLTFVPIEKVRPGVDMASKGEPSVELLKQPGKKPPVLTVEDDVDSQHLIRFFLRDFYTLLFARSASEARNQLENNKVALILLDLSLAGDEDGLDLARYLRNSEKWRDIPIIALTAHAFTKDRDNCLDAGCNDYLSKPITQEKLLKKIRRFV